MQSDLPVLETNLQGHLKLLARGKVRELYEVDEYTLLFVTTDKISAYDVVMKNGVSQKGALLTAISVKWFEYLRSKMPTLQTHFISPSLPPALQENLPPYALSQLHRRSMLVRRLKILPVEAIVRGYITGSAWKEYTQRGTVHGMPISGPNGRKLVESERLEKPIYTPSTKAELGAKDENIHPDRATEILGHKNAHQISQLSLEIYTKAYEHALPLGIIIADTKFEFGLDPATDDIVLVDEVLTPDSSRFWPAATYRPGAPQPSFDKQDLRDWLTSQNLQGRDGVDLPEDVIRRTGDKYRKAYEMLVGRAWGESGSVMMDGR